MENLFSFFNLTPSVFIDKQKLDDVFYHLQKQIHPDEKNDPFYAKAALTLSAKITKAYSDLKDPLFCIESLLKLKGAKELNELSKQPEYKDLLLDIFDLQEKFLNIEKDDFIKNLQKKLSDLAKDIENAYLQSDLTKLEKNALYFFYLWSLKKRALQRDAFEELSSS
ncbi:MAG: Co-chaperone protein HscB [Holosporales bacterium]